MRYALDLCLRLRCVRGMSFGSMSSIGGISVIFHFRFLLRLMMRTFCVFFLFCHCFHFRFLYRLIPSFSCMYSKPVSMRFVASLTFVAVLHVHSSDWVRNRACSRLI